MSENDRNAGPYSPRRRRFLLEGSATAAGFLLASCGDRPTEAQRATANTGTPSPTGRTPKLCWTPQRQETWNRMRAANQAWWKVLAGNAERSGTRAARYADDGQWATLCYQITGQESFARKAFQEVRPLLGSVPSSRNTTREHFIDLVWMYDWLYPALTDFERKMFLGTMNQWADAVTGKTWKPRMDDSDEVIGHYFGMAFLDLATGPDNPRAGEFLAHPAVGGLVASEGSLNSTMRNAIRAYLELAAGGVWIESTEYNLGTLRLLLMGLDGVKTARNGRDYFPEASEFIDECATATIHDVGPGLEQCYNWGDVQDVRTTHVRRRITVLGLLAAATEQKPSIGPVVNSFLSDFADKHNCATDPANSPWSPFFIYVNPYAEKAAWKSTLTRGHYAPGMGLMLFHTGWERKDSMFGAHMATHTGVDHATAFFGNFQLLRKGQWVFTHPNGYGTSGADFQNSMSFAGMSSMSGLRKPIAQQFGAGYEFAYLAGTTGGSPYWPTYYDPPPDFLHEWTRSIVYLPSDDATVDTIVIYDRTSADDPKALPKVERYRKPDQERLKAAKTVKEWILHTPQPPVMTDDSMVWTVGDQSVRAETLLPKKFKRNLVDEDAAWEDKFPYPTKSEQKFQVRLSPETEQRWDTFLHVLQASDKGLDLRSSLVRSAGGEVEGALVQRPHHADVLCLFGAREKQRVLDVPFSVEWTAAEENTKVYLFDLDPKRKWTAVVDGQNRPLEVTESGTARVVVPGNGKRSLRVAS